MTTVCYRNGVLAADTRAFGGTAVPIGNKHKIHKLPDGTAFGISSNTPGTPELLVRWFIEEKDDDFLFEIPEGGFVILEIEADGSVYYYSDSFSRVGPLDAPFFAIGSGKEYALGAMACGASATEAVVVAAEFDVWTSGKVEHVEIDSVTEALTSTGESL